MLRTVSSDPTPIDRSRTSVQDGMLIEWDVGIAMDDGVVLRADVFRPPDDARVPVILSYGPYGKGLHFEDGYPDQWRILCELFPEVTERSTNAYQCWEVCDPERWVPAGYACVRVDSRGAGRSPGRIDPFSPRETLDLYACIEWAGARPWSSGRVGLSGISYYAMNQWQVAAMQPPSLAAMCVWEGAADWYRDSTRHGGIASTFWQGWMEHQVHTVQYGLGEHGPRSRVTGMPVCGDVTLPEEDLRANRVDLGAEIAAHPLIDRYYEERIPDWDRIVTPLLSAGNWGGAGLHLRGNTDGFVRSASEEKWLELHGLHHWVTYYTDEGIDLQRRFFDRFLKGEDDAWLDVPRVLLHVRHADGTFTKREESEWPIARTRWTSLFLDASTRSLTFEGPRAASAGTYDPVDGDLTFRLVVEEPTEITGPLALKVWASSATTDADLFVILRLFDPTGSEVTFQGALDPHSPVAHGWLRASHRDIDEELSEPSRPFHPHTDAAPLTPHEVYELDVEIWPTSIVVPAGYTLACTIQGRDYAYSDQVEEVAWFRMTGVGPFAHDDPDDRSVPSLSGEVTIHTGGRRPSHLLLPVIPASDDDASGSRRG
jgi:predicted acyl esterase